MLPALPTGMQSASSSPSSSSSSSKAAVFCPSMRNSLTEFTSTIGCVSVSSRTSSSAWSKLPASEITRAPCISVWASLPVAILPSGTITAQVMPGPRGVGGGARGGVAGRGADHRLGALAHRRRDRAGHAAVLEGAGRVGALELEVDLAPTQLREHGRAQQRRRALLQAHERVAGRERQPLAEALDQRHVRAAVRDALTVGRSLTRTPLRSRGLRAAASARSRTARPRRRPRAGATRAADG